MLSDLAIFAQKWLKIAKQIFFLQFPGPYLVQGRRVSTIELKRRGWAAAGAAVQSDDSWFLGLALSVGNRTKAPTV